MSRKPASRTARKAAAPAAATPNIHIDIDPTVSAGFIHDRYDLLIRGRAVSPAPIQQIVLTMDDAVVGRVEYGPMDSMPAGLADDGGLTQYAFNLNVALRRDDAHRTCSCVIAATTPDGSSFLQRFDLSVNPDKPTPVTIVSGPTHPSSVYAHVRPPVVLYVERAALDDHGQLLVVGWAISRNAMVAVQAFVDEQQLDAAQLGGRRDDVANAFPAYGTSEQG